MLVNIVSSAAPVAVVMADPSPAGLETQNTRGVFVFLPQTQDFWTIGNSFQARGCRGAMPVAFTLFS